MALITEAEAEGASIIKYEGEGTVAMSGPGQVTFICGSCSAPLLKGVDASMVRQMVFVCKGCGSYNQTLN